MPASDGADDALDHRARHVAGEARRMMRPTGLAGLSNSSVSWLLHYRRGSIFSLLCSLHYSAHLGSWQ